MIAADVEDAAGRLCLLGFYVRPRELVWFTVAGSAEALLAGFAASAGFSPPALSLLAVPILSCWAALKLRIGGAVIERWLLDMGLFILRGRILAAGDSPQQIATCRRRIQLDYLIDRPGRSLGRGKRTARGFRFEVGA